MDTNTTIIQQQADLTDVCSTPKEGDAAVIVSTVESSQVLVTGTDQESASGAAVVFTTTNTVITEPTANSAGDEDEDYEGDSGSDGESDDDEEMPRFSAGRPRAPLFTNQTGPKRKKPDTTPRAGGKSVKDPKKADNTANNTASTSTPNSDTKDSKPKMNKPAVGPTTKR